MIDDPIAYFITWTVYGTFLQGDARWWRSREKGKRPPQPLLEQWHRDRLKHDVILLTESHRRTVSSAVAKHCNHRGWVLHIDNPRSNHVHVVVSAKGYDGRTVRDQLKANATGALRRSCSEFKDRKVWTTGGDWKCINSDDDLQQAILYAGEVQERMDRGK